MYSVCIFFYIQEHPKFYTLSQTYTSTNRNDSAVICRICGFLFRVFFCSFSSSHHQHLSFSLGRTAFTILQNTFRYSILNGEKNKNGMLRNWKLLKASSWAQIDGIFMYIAKSIFVSCSHSDHHWSFFFAHSNVQNSSFYKKNKEKKKLPSSCICYFTSFHLCAITAYTQQSICVVMSWCY